MSGSTEDARQRLRFHLDMQEGFWFALVVGTDEEALAELRDDAGEHVAVRDFEVQEGREVALAAELAGRRDALCWLVVKDRSVARALLSAMNERRDAYRRGPGPGIVIEGPSWLKVELRHAAPDLFSVRACILEPGLEHEDLLPEDLTEERTAVQPRPAPAWVLPSPSEAREGVERDLARARSLEARADVSALRARVAAMRRAATTLLEQGWTGEAHPIVEAILALLQPLVSGHLWVRAERATALEMLGRTTRQHGFLRESREALDASLGDLDCLRDGRELDGSTAALQEAAARVCWLLGEVAWAAGDLPNAQTHLSRALRLGEELVEYRSANGQDVSGLRDGLARTWSLLADVAEAADRASDAADAWVAALAIRADLVEIHPDDRAAQRAFSISLGRVARVAEREGDRVGALELRKRAWAVADELSMRQPERPGLLMESTTARTHMARTLLDLGRVRSARFHLVKVLEARRQLVERDGTNAEWHYRYAACMIELSRVALAEGDGGAAAAWSQRALRRLESLLAQDPSRVQWRLGHQRGLVRRAEAYFRTRRYRHAARDLIAARTSLADMFATDPRRRWGWRLTRLAIRTGDAWLAASEPDVAAAVWWEAVGGEDEATTVGRVLAGGVSLLGAWVGLAQLGEVSVSDVRAALAALHERGDLERGEVSAWEAALAVRSVASPETA